MTLEQRIDEAEARIAIADLIHAYARFIRRDEPELVHTLFAEGGTFEVRDGHPDKADSVVRAHYASPAEFHAYMSTNKGKPHPIPLIHNLIVEVEGDAAQANCVMEAQIYGTSHKVIGEYHDSFRRVDGRWMFASRIYTIFTGASSA